MKKTITKVLALALFILPFSIAIPAGATAPENWSLTGDYVIAFNYLGSDYNHDLSLTQNGTGNLTGSGGYPTTGVHTYSWVLDSGTVNGSSIDIVAHYTAPADAVTPLTVLHMVGTIATSGALSGTWTDNYQGGSRAGTWVSASGTAHVLSGTLTAEDFGVVNYNTGLGFLKGYSAGFGLTDATFADVQSVVVKLYAGGTLLQTNTATAKVGDEIIGNQISSPFDVSGNFNYATDGYWINVKESQYGQSVPATRVVATVTLANGKILSAENTNLTGDPTTIYPVIVPPQPSPTAKSACMNKGWKTFTNPTFKNQGQCVKYVEHVINHHGK